MSTPTQLMTAEELFCLNDGLQHELIKGELLTMSPAGGEHGILLARIARVLLNYSDTTNDGIVYGADTGFKIETGPDTVLAPDAAYVISNRAEMRSDKYLTQPPDLIVEVLSPCERKSQIEWKTDQWLTFGVSSVWSVNPKTRTVQVVKTNGDKKLFYETDELTDDLMPEFSVRLSDIFI